MKAFTIIINNNSYTSNEDGFLNLNDIWNREQLPKAKRPSEFTRYHIGKELSQSGNSRTLTLPRAVGETRNVSYVGGDEFATIAYAMWISVDFYSTVVDSFVALRNGEVEKAVALAQTTSIETHSHNKWMNYAETPIRDACGMLDVSHTALFMHLAKKPKQLESFIERGILKNRNYGTHGSSLRITRLGKAWMKENIDTINNTLETIHNKVTL